MDDRVTDAVLLYSVRQIVAEWMDEQNIPNPEGHAKALLDFMEDDLGLFVCRENQAVIDGEVIEITRDGVGYGEFDRYPVAVVPVPESGETERPADQPKETTP